MSTEAERVKKIKDAFDVLGRLVRDMDFERGHVSQSYACSRFGDHLTDAALWAEQVAKQPDPIGD